VILKDKDGPIPSNKTGKAGYEAERQMAFYLRRAFGESPDVFVFHDLRVVRNGEVGQIDHLVLHPYGFFLIESKSVTGSIEVNKQLEFVRVFGRQRKGMKSPIAQVKMQAELLQALLNDQKEKLRRKVLLGFVQAYFGEQRFATLVAISDGGEIKRKGCDPPELVKADQVTGVIQDLITRRDKTKGIAGALRMVLADKKTARQLQEDELPAFTADELSSIQQFLLSSHQRYVQPPPVVQDPALSAPKPPPPPTPVRVAESNASFESQQRHRCRHCQSEDIEIVYGQYGYYFKCRSCTKNTRIDFSCPQCGVKAKITKRGPVFRWKCAGCGNDSHFYTNPEVRSG
jgi:hypothetical protein